MKNKLLINIWGLILISASKNGHDRYLNKVLLFEGMSPMQSPVYCS